MALNWKKWPWTWSYVTLGVGLGLLVPCVSTLLYLALRQHSLSFSNVVSAQSDNLALWLLDLAPVILGVLSFRAGRHQDLAEAHSFDLERRLEQVSAMNKALADEIGVKAELEEQLRHSQKLEAVGRLAGGVAHDFNNLLTAIIGYADLLSGELGPQDPRSEYADEIRRAGDRAAALVQQLLGFSRKQMVSPRVVDLNKVVANSRKLLERVIGENIRLDVIESDAPLHAFIDPVQVDQILVNLVVNGRDAMPEGGTITLRVAQVAVSESDCESRPEASAGEFGLLEVSDTGIGMDQSMLGKIFEPFYTTKSKSKGTGLGLATTYGIAKQNGGFIEVSSSLGYGSVFKIHLPLRETAEEKSTSAAALKARGGQECVLLVEDDRVVRALACKALRDRGYNVIEAAQASEAERIWILKKSDVDLLVTDIIMPGRDGKELSDVLRADRPDLKVLYMSGYDDDLLGKHAVLDEKVEFLPKPFTVDGLAQKVRQVLDAPASAPPEDSPQQPEFVSG